MEWDVIVVGYGPSGAVAANLLGQRGLRTLVVERSPEIYQIPRAVHFDGEVMRIFQAIGVAEQLDKCSEPATSLGYMNGRGRRLMHVEVGDAPRSQGWTPSNFFNQPELEACLRRAARAYPNVEVRLGWELSQLEQDAAGVRATLRRVEDGTREVVEAGWLLGSDGASSRAREQLGIPLEDLHCDEPWLIVDALAPEGMALEKTAWQICDWRRPTTLVPCEGRHLRWEFLLMPGDDPEAIVSDASVRALMAPHLRHLNPALEAGSLEILRRAVYTFHGLVAERFWDGRVFLLGDAAHQTPPFLGQGMCAGIRDAWNLVWKLEAVERGRLAPAVLETYSSERRVHARAVVAQAIAIGGIIMTTSRLKAALRDARIRLARVLPRRRGASGWGSLWPLGPGLFGASEPPAYTSAHGLPINQPFVETDAGERTRLDAVLGEGWAVLGLGVDPEAACAGSRATLEAIGARFVHAVPRGSAAPAGGVTDAEGGLARWFERAGGRLAVVRPDRQVYACCGSMGSDALAAELREALVPLERALPEGAS